MVSNLPLTLPLAPVVASYQPALDNLIHITISLPSLSCVGIAFGITFGIGVWYLWLFVDRVPLLFLFFSPFFRAAMSDQLSVLFVCLGNICRSTMAEGVFQSLARKEPYSGLVGKIDSCGTGESHSLPSGFTTLIMTPIQAATTSVMGRTNGQWRLLRITASPTTCTVLGRFDSYSLGYRSSI